MTTSDLMPGIATETLQCFAGHEWIRPYSKGGKPTSCPEHVRFLNEPLSARMHPPKRLTALWLSTAVLDEPDEYVRRWTKVWTRTVRILGAQAGTFASIDLPGVEEYVQHKRLAELHRAYAEYEPYQTTIQGSIKPHPGWYQSQVSDKFARQAAIRLGLEDGGDAVRDAGGSDPEDDFEVYDDQLGPDGKPL
jgi:hypothetical protein